MSKASEWAKTGIRSEAPAYGLPGFVARVQQGNENVPEMRFDGYTMINAERACDFARWILDTFGEEP